MEDVVVVVTVGVGVGQEIVSACFAIFFHVHAVVTIVTGGGVEVPVSVGFVSSLHFLGHVHTVSTYMSHKEFLLPAHVVIFLFWQVLL
jgi:hypothetical protein